MNTQRVRQSDCPGTGRKVDIRKPKSIRSRGMACPECGRSVAINYDGRLRHHVAHLR